MSKISSKQIKKLIDESLNEFFKKEKSLIETDVSERALCCRLAMCFERKIAEYSIDGYYADTEFNRKQNGEIKTIIRRDLKVVNITCDLIVHSRGEKQENDNLIAIEMGKSHNKTSTDIEQDYDRLIALTKDLNSNEVWIKKGYFSHPKHVCGYRRGIFIEINKVNKDQPIEINLEFFAHGAHLKDLSKTIYI